MTSSCHAAPHDRVEANVGSRHRSTSLENVFLPADYMESLNEFTGQSHARYVQGKWVQFEGLVYESWDPTVFVTDDGNYKPTMVFAGVDKGYPSPSSIIVVAVDRDERPRVLHEFYQAKTLSVNLIQSAKQLAKQYNIEQFLIDPSCAELIDQFNAEGLGATKANNDVQAGINCVAGYLHILADEKPYLTVSPACVNLVKASSRA